MEHETKTEGRHRPIRAGVFFVGTRKNLAQRPASYQMAARGGFLKYFVLTNNPMVCEKAAPGVDVVYKPGGIQQIFEEAACYIARGHRLLTHPLSGSVKPGETPYKSMLMSSDASQDMDLASSRLISNAIDACGKFGDKTSSYSEQTLRDLQLVDASLISGAMGSALVS